MNRVVVPRVPAVGARVVVDAPGSHHLLNVQRVARGAPVELVGEDGRRGRGRLVEGHGAAVVEVDEVDEPGPRLPSRVVLLGVPKGPALDEAVTVAVEAGASELVLVLARRSPPGVTRRDRLDRLVRAAMTQSGNPLAPELAGPESLQEALRRALPPQRFVATPGAPGGTATPGAAAVAVGPEGGWAPEEQAMLLGAGFTPLGLGPWVFRTPQAVVVSLARLWPG